MKFTQDQFDYMQASFSELSEQEKEMLRKAIRSDIGRVIGKIMGPDFVSFMALLRTPRRGIAAPR
jgi:hypothetical protein